VRPLSFLGGEGKGLNTLLVIRGIALRRVFPAVILGTNLLYWAIPAFEFGRIFEICPESQLFSDGGSE